MRIWRHLVLMLLVLSMMLSACGAAPAEETVAAPEAAQPTDAVQETVAEETEPEVQKPAFLEKLHYQPQLAETVLPEKDEPTGTLFFYLNDKTVYAGGPVSDIIDVGFHTYSDLSEIIQPWHMSGAIRAEIILTGENAGENPFVYFVAMNASDEPRAISDCIIYSISVNYQNGVSFGTGHEDEPFVTGTTKRDELVEAYGEPTYIDARRTGFEEIFYYQPFSCVSFMFKYDVLKQVNAYYGANVYGALAEDVDFELTGSAMENDAMIFMSQYMDVTPYLPEKAAEEGEDEQQSAEATEPTESVKKLPEGTGILASLDDSFELDGNTIAFGSQVSELPSPFLEDLNGLTMPVNKNFYVRTGRHDPEEFFLININGQTDSLINTMSIKGVIVENPNYCNWGFDNSGFHSFNCQGVTQDSTIDEVLELLGKPMKMQCTSGERICYIWMFYETEAGDYIRVRVDPMMNQVIEVNMVKYFTGEHSY